MSIEELSLLWTAVWPTLSGVVAFAGHAVAAAHAILTKREVRAAIGWVGVIWLAPVVGPILYLVLGINRISRRAARFRGARGRRAIPHGPPGSSAVVGSDASARLSSAAPGIPQQLVQLSHLVFGLTSRPLSMGNRVTPLSTGDAAYEAMLAAIDSAEHSVGLSTYIFDVDEAGKRFVDAFAAAVRRGVQVRVLIDDAGARYSFPSARRKLREVGVEVAHFMPALSPLRAPYINLRNHRKVLTVDGRQGFTGGMNIRRGHLASTEPAHAIIDVHFALEGPIVSHLQRVFVDDWLFASGELLEGPGWFPSLESVGDTVARGIVDGPDDDFETLQWALQGAIACARSSIRIMTPYFLPDQRLLAALDVAAMRGVRVDVLVPERGNLMIVSWAMWAQFEQLVARGCRLWLSSAPFDHSKLMVVDDHWSLFGSANWDARSLRLNFECCVECYDPLLARQLADHIAVRCDQARRLEHDELAGRGLLVRLRDGIAWLFAPYL